MRQIVFSCRRGFDHFQGKLHTHKLRVRPLVWISLVRAQLGTDMSLVRRAVNAHGATCSCLRVSYPILKPPCHSSFVCSYTHMLTPPYHFSIVACPAISQVQAQDDPKAPAQILYRGSIPATRNLPFLKRLGLKTVIYCKKKELKEDDVFCRWTRKREIDLRWVKAEGMGEEKLGLGKNEISDVLKVSRVVVLRLHHGLM